LISNGNYGLEPNRSAARLFFDLLTARGITISGAAANETRPADVELATLAALESAPLSAIIEEMLHTSDNNTAELMLKEIGVADSGRGTRQAGLEAMWAQLGRWGVPREGLEMEDGSGLSRANRVSCATLAALLADAPVATELVALLPTAGRDGTLTDQFVGTVADGELQAKTGTLTDVKALTGTQPAGDGSPVEFALVLNGVGVDDPAAHQPIWADVIGLIDTYPVEVEPAVDVFAPR
jgi:D-alanyl-D-alanine carboxypeptidase/D-alanyl-D-alanine-endopeptidase (penicillin-binding protein 4)